MPTYALITRATEEQVLTALRPSKLGGYLLPDGERGTGVLFDPLRPRFGKISSRRLVGPAWNLAWELKQPVWLLRDNEWGTCVTLVLGNGDTEELGWSAHWTPPADPAENAAQRESWDRYCARLADRAGLPDAGAALAAIRNDPAPDGSRTSGAELLGRLCALVGVSDAVVGQSLYEQAGPRGREARRFEARGR
ncbi:hypothetical protein AB0D08_30460 [Kitasatospora sp. NPDC048540]|uniref:hypothetical protein n=1 Tax=Kitasatospora sp. NPDC048540 TaxID=3155634 RepID=UPI00053A546A